MILLKNSNYLFIRNFFQKRSLILQIETFLKEKENIFNKLYDLQIEFEERDQDVTDLQREEVEKLRDLFRTRTKMTWNVVMTQEITLVTQTEQVILNIQNCNAVMLPVASKHF